MAGTKQRIGYQDGGAVPLPIPVADPGAGAGLTTGTVGGAIPPPIPIADPGGSQTPNFPGYTSAPMRMGASSGRRMKRGRNRGPSYARGGPVEPDDDDTVYPTTAPKWDQLSPEAAMMGASVGYARGGTVQSNDINKRAALLAGLRKRYDAMIAMAQGAHAHGDIKAAAHLATKAHDMVPDGKNLTHNVTPDGHILSVVHSPQGGVHSTHAMSPEQFHHYLVGPATSFDHVLENGVHKNLAIASGGQHTPVAEHPNDPIHRVRQVLHHTRKMFGVDKIGQAAPPVGYGTGG